MEKITLPLEVKEVDNKSDVFTFEGHLAAFNNIDHYGDRIIKGAFNNWLTKSMDGNKKSIPVFWSHASNEPIGVFPLKDMVEDDQGLFVKGILPKDDTFVTGRVIPQMKIGSISQMSIGYSAKDFDYDDNIRILKGIDLWEGSLVAIPANENATITSFKAVTPFGDLPLANRQRLWDSDAAIGRVREWAGIEDQNDMLDPDVQAKYKQAFFWYDQENSDLFGAYKLPFADIINGVLTAVPRGVFAAAAAMRGARGGVFVPDNDRPGIVRNIEKYYNKLDLESPFEKSFRIDDLASIDERNMEKILKTGVRFPDRLAKSLIWSFKQTGLITTKQVMDETAILESINSVLSKIKG